MLLITKHGVVTIGQDLARPDLLYVRGQREDIEAFADQVRKFKAERLPIIEMPGNDYPFCLAVKRGLVGSVLAHLVTRDLDYADLLDVVPPGPAAALLAVESRLVADNAQISGGTPSAESDCWASPAEGK